MKRNVILFPAGNKFTELIIQEGVEREHKKYIKEVSGKFMVS